ncbi:hypothetical protein LV156_008996 [Aspergillus fumigatus]|nr:hypothetical protein LV156_008996 [Aspergillus fumigatus]KAJ8227804.1 hypothetical protein LV160_009001 [Aspergillus fumigatus]
MVSTRSGKNTSQSPSGIQKNVSARKNRENPSVAALKKSIQTKRKQREEDHEAIKNELQATESQLQNSELLTQAEREQLQEKRSLCQQELLAIEADIMKADNDLMDVDEGHTPTEEGTLFVPPQSAIDNETPLKTENVERSIADTPAGKSANPAFTPELIMNSLKQGGRRSPVDHGKDDKFDDILVRMESLPTVGHSGGVGSGGVGDAWCRARRSIRIIARYGPPHAAKYVIQPGHRSLTRGLQEVSNAETRLCNIMVTDDKGERHRRYGVENIVGIAGVAISPEGTYVKLIWTGIDKEHQHLCPNGYNWNRRTDLKDRFGKKLSELQIWVAWKRQEERFNDWEEKSNPGSPGRLPTPFPFDVFYRRKRRGSVPLQAQYTTSIKREETPLASTEATAAATTPELDTVANLPGATGSSDTKAPVRKHAPEKQTNMTEDPSGQQNNSESQVTFSKKQYLEGMLEDMDVDKTDRTAYVEALALARAHYDTYKAYMLSRGAIEVV